MLNIVSKIYKNLFRNKKSRGQVFILATLMIVVYSVSIIAVVTQLSLIQHNKDEIDLQHAVDEFNTEINYQLQLELFNYIKNPLITENDVIINLQTFITTFVSYARLKGIEPTINLRIDELNLVATKNNAVLTPINFVGGDYEKITFLSVNSSILFQSISGGSKISGILQHFYGVKAFISQTTQTILTLSTIDIKGNNLQYIAGATFTAPLPVPTDNNNGNYIYAGGYNTATIYATLPSGIEILS